MRTMDITLHYREAGAGEPLILLHGNGESGAYFAHQLEYFASRYHVIAPDTRGHGDTPRGEAPFTIAQFARDLYAFMVHNGMEKAVILGFSDGANIAMRFALDHPEMVKALILNGGNLDPRGVKRTVQLPIELGYRVARLFAKRSEEAKRHAELLALMVEQPHLTPAELSAITAPTLVICGTKDMIKESHTREIAQSIRGARLVLVKGDHFIANKEHDAFNREVERFLRFLSL